VIASPRRLSVFDGARATHFVQVLSGRRLATRRIADAAPAAWTCRGRYPRFREFEMIWRQAS
jgi:hypothetical protein